MSLIALSEACADARAERRRAPQRPLRCSRRWSWLSVRPCVRRPIRAAA